MIAETSSSNIETLTKKRSGTEDLSSTSLPPLKRTKIEDNKEQHQQQQDDDDDDEDRRMKESELERKRWASRESSRRTRERERRRFDYFAEAKAKLERANANLKSENQRVRILIDMIKRSKALSKAAVAAPLLGQPLRQPPAILNPSMASPPQASSMQPQKNPPSISFPTNKTPSFQPSSPNLQSLLFQTLAGNPPTSLTGSNSQQQRQPQSASQLALAFLSRLQTSGNLPLVGGGTTSTVNHGAMQKCATEMLSFPSVMMANNQTNLFSPQTSALFGIHQQQQHQQPKNTSTFQ